jgi:glutamyl-tRNA reductase
MEKWDTELAALKNKLGVSELLYVATCNRVEYILYGEQLDDLMTNIDDHLHVDSSQARFYSQTSSVIQHLLEVALSMDSVVFGENQILGQLKNAYQLALKHRTCGTKISVLWQNILKHAKSVRTKNHLSNIHNTVSTVAGKDFILHRDTDLPILLIGAGESNQLLARYLVKRGFKNFIWTNRTDKRAEDAASNIGGSFLTWEEFLAGNIPHVEAVFATTNAGKIIVTKDELIKANCLRAYDLSIPANIDEKDCLSLDIEYIGIDKIQKTLEAEQERYEKLKSAITKDIAKAVDKIERNLSERNLSPIISESLGAIDEIVSKAMDDLPKDLQSLDGQQLEALKKWTRSLVQKTKHQHISQIKKLKK